MPVVTALAFRVEAQYKALLELNAQLIAAASNADAGEDEGIDEQLLHVFESAAFVTQQMLETALMADYGDEIGRRKMFTLIREHTWLLPCAKLEADVARPTGEMISNAELPSVLIPSCMDVLLKLSNGERDFQRVVVEIVQNVREAEDAVAGGQGAAPPADAEDEDDEEELDLDTATAEDIAADHRRRLEKAAKKIQNQSLNMDMKDTYIRCLAIVRALLERVAGVSRTLPSKQERKAMTDLAIRQTLQDNATLMGVVHELIVPSVRSKEPEIRENGLICLGLCCLLDKVRFSPLSARYLWLTPETDLRPRLFRSLHPPIARNDWRAPDHNLQDHLRHPYALRRFLPRSERPQRRDCPELPRPRIESGLDGDSGSRGYGNIKTYALGNDHGCGSPQETGPRLLRAGDSG